MLSCCGGWLLLGCLNCCRWAGWTLVGLVGGRWAGRCVVGRVGRLETDGVERLRCRWRRRRCGLLQGGKVGWQVGRWRTLGLVGGYASTTRADPQLPVFLSYSWPGSPLSPSAPPFRDTRYMISIYWAVYTFFTVSANMPCAVRTSLM